MKTKPVSMFLSALILLVSVATACSSPAETSPTSTPLDPDDKVPAPGKQQPRTIANDGGQRRIGSGWGVEAAPLDRDEWEAKRDIYHTGTMERVLDEDGLTVAVADVTPTYTNTFSGKGTFSHRTRRVERFWRTFAYDRIDDVIVVFDQVIATRSAFRKRWLLHSIEEPRTSPTGFEVAIAPQNRPGRAGGHLRGVVLLPRDASINAVGGPGLEFLVDDRNYDENGKLTEIVTKLGPNRSEPGAWRIEVSPLRDAREDQFLVVMLPSIGGGRSSHQVRLLEADARVGCEIPIPLAAGAIVSLVIAHYRAFGSTTNPATRIPITVVVGLLAFLMVSTIRYRTFKDVHLSARSLVTFAFLVLAGLAVGLATRASFVLVVYMGAYILMGLAESIFFRHRTLEAARPHPQVRAEIEADDALEPDADDVEAKEEGDEYI